MTPLSDEALVAAAQGGDRSALDQLLRRHYDRVYAVCRRVTGSASDADDACQEALIKITRALPRFDGRSAFGTWAYRIATNASLDELRRRKRRPAPHTVTEDDQREVVDAMAAKRVEAIEDRLALDDALGELAEDFRAAVVLRDVIDLDYAEIAEILDVPVGTVKSRIARGRSALAATLRLDDLLTDPRIGRAVTVEPTGEATGDDLLGAGNQNGDDERPTDATNVISDE
ncbi:MAG: sigma-70 family RNA polymerase sigma factor [Ilumatobacter sp.]|nr:sigma-70 family RNA polymerase sigma factor [Ilumatobacter sp.]